jgi:hypothetical protein
MQSQAAMRYLFMLANPNPGDILCPANRSYNKSNSGVLQECRDRLADTLASLRRMNSTDECVADACAQSMLAMLKLEHQALKKFESVNSAQQIMVTAILSLGDNVTPEKVQKAAAISAAASKRAQEKSKSKAQGGKSRRTKKQADDDTADKVDIAPRDLELVVRFPPL